MRHVFCLEWRQQRCRFFLQLQRFRFQFYSANVFTVPNFKQIKNKCTKKVNIFMRIQKNYL